MFYQPWYQETPETLGAMRELEKHPVEVPKGKDICHFGFLSPQNSSDFFVLGVGGIP